MSEADSLSCRRCNGTGRVGPVHINRGSQPHEWRASIECYDCGGSGKWTAERIELYERGQRHRALRVLAGESLREAAKRLGIRPAQLSDFELGRTAPDDLPQQLRFDG